MRSICIWTVAAAAAGFAGRVLKQKGYLKNVSVKFLPFLVFYLSFVITITLTKRATGTAEKYNLQLFWSYRKIYAGSYALIAQIFWNIVLFIPIGAMFSLIWKKKSFWLYIGCGLLLSLGIEILQLLMHRGLFEFDDMLHNTIGMILGVLLVFPFEKQKRRYVIGGIVLFLWSGFLIAWTTAVISVSPSNLYKNIVEYLRSENSDAQSEPEVNNMIAEPENKIDDSSMYFSFQVDQVTEEKDNIIVLNGFAFPYNSELADGDLCIFLRSTSTGDELEAGVQSGLERKDVNQYFSCLNDYSHVGFRASFSADRLFNLDEYAIYMKWSLTQVVFTGVYLTGTSVHYTPQKDFLPPVVKGTDLETIVNEGVLRVYRPDRSCYVYQYEGNLYWIVDGNFHFEEDERTYIQYQLYTTQYQKLPGERKDNKLFWDNIGGLFEENEITEEMDCGQYRVCRRALPTDYSITSILTGYYIDNNWIWKEYFRPYYDFG